MSKMRIEKMKLLIVMLALLILSAGCAKERAITEIDKELEATFNDFLNEAYARGVLVDYSGFKMRVVSDEIMILNLKSERVVGVCFPNKEVWIKRSVVNPHKLKRVVFHELGHCLLRKRHEDTRFEIMNSSITTEEYEKLYKNWEEHLDYLFDVQRIN